MTEDERDELIKQIIALEWKFFDKVPNEGGRAACQDDFRTFRIMRGSQYAAWSDEMLESYMDDLMRALAEGRNPLTEKYGYMMCIAAPERNAKLAGALPVVSAAKRAASLRIIGALAPLNDAFAKKYPRVAGRARPLRASGEDEEGTTSMETYQLGELWTYSLRTLELMERHLEEFAKKGRSYPEEVIESSIKRRGFKSLRDAEDYLASRGL